MANKLYNDTSVKAIADAIRAKNGKTDTYTVGEMAGAISSLSGKESVTWHQCPEAPRNFINNVTYDPNDYSTSQIQNYAPATAVVSNTKPIGTTVDGVTYYNEVPNVETPFASTNAAGTLKPLDALRWINSQTSNVRDLGGWTCDGGTVKYGMLFRGGEPSANDKALVNQLGIKAELSLLGNESQLTSSVWGIDYYRYPTNYAWYNISNKAVWKANIGYVFEKVNYGSPLYFHCSAGADRTGTIAVMLEALLGVSQSDIDKDYELTNFYTVQPTNPRRRNADAYKNYINQIKNVPLVGGLSDTFANHAISFAVSIGFTADEINAYRNACIDGTPAQITLNLPTYTITNNLTDVVNSNTDTSITQYQDYIADLTVANGYVISDVQIKLNDADVTDLYFTGTKTTLNYSIQKNLTNCHLNGKNTVIAGQSYVAEIIADTGFTMDGATITITMGGIDMSNYYSNGKIAIPNVTGNIVITATAVPSAPVNLFIKTPQYTPTSTATYVDEVAIGGRLSSDGGVKYWMANKLVTRYIVASVGDTITVTTDTDSITGTYDWYISVYDSSKTYINQTTAESWTFDNGNKTGVLTIPTSSPWQGTAFVKINLPYTDIDNIVITKH